MRTPHRGLCDGAQGTRDSPKRLVRRSTRHSGLPKEACVSRIKPIETPWTRLCDGAQGTRDSTQTLVSEGSSRSRKGGAVCVLRRKAVGRLGGCVDPQALAFFQN